MFMVRQIGLSLAPMNRILLLLALVFFFLLCSQCSTDFDVTGEHKETTIIYGLLDASETTQYIRIQRAYLNEEGSALDVATNSDSIYFADDLEVKLIRFDENQNQLGQVTMERVSGDESGIAKEPGIFGNSPSWLYRTDATVEEGDIYRLEVNTPDGNTVTAETQIVGDFKVWTPKDLDSLNFSLNSDSIVELRWRQNDYGFVYDAEMTMIYDEQDIVNPNGWESKSISDIVVSGRRQPDQNDIFISRYTVQNLLDFMNRNIEDNANVERRFRELRFNFITATEDVYNFQLVNFAQFSVAAGQSTPVYTNLDGALGIFSSRFNRYFTGIGLQAGVVEQMSCSSTTEHLNFRGHPASLYYPGCPPN